MTERRAPIPFVRSIAGILWLQAATVVLAVAAGATVARTLGPEGKGILTLALLVPATVEMVLNGGIGTAHAYYGGSRRADIRELWTNAVVFAGIIGLGGLVLIGLFLVTGLAAVLAPTLPREAVAVAALSLPFLLLNRYFEGILQGLQRLRSVHAVRLGEAAAVLGLLLLLVAGLQLGPVAAIAAYVMGAVVALIVLVAILRAMGARFTAHWSTLLARRTLGFGLRGHPGNVLQYMNYRLDMFLVVFFLGPTAVGVYSVSVRLAEMLWYLPDAVGFAILPKAAGSKAADMNVFTPRAFWITFGLTTVAAAGVALVGRPLIELIYSRTFAPAYLPLLALLPGGILLGAAKVLTNDIAGRGYPQYNSINAGIALVVTVALDLLLIPRYGILGAAIASSAAYGLVFGVAVGFYREVSRRALPKCSHAGAADPSAAVSTWDLKP